MAGFFKKLFGRGGQESSNETRGAGGAGTATETRKNTAQERRARKKAAAPAETPAQAEARQKHLEWQQQKQEAEAENQKIRERRQAAQEAAKAAIAEVNSVLSAGGLSDADRNYYQWVLESARNAYDKSLAQSKDTYTVQVMDKATRIAIAQREEGMPVEDLIAITQGKLQRLGEQEDFKKQAELANQRVLMEIDGKDSNRASKEEEEKLAWHQAYEKILPNTHALRKEAEALVLSWEQKDGKIYGEKERKQQLGAALRQILIDRGLIDKKGHGIGPAVNVDPAEIKRLEKIVQTLSVESKKYFDYHSASREAAQHPYTEREADLIAKDPRYRGHLLKKYRDQAELPKDFGHMEAKEQDYQLAMLVVRDRQVLDLPKEKEVPVEPPRPIQEGPELGKTIYRVNVSEIAQRMAKTLADARLEEYYTHSNWFYRKARALTENWNRLKFYDEALKEITQDQNLLKAMEARSLADQNLAGQQADQRGAVKKTLHIGSKEAATKVAAARASAAYKPSMDEYYELMDSVMEEYEHDVVDDKELGETLKASDNLNAELAKLLVAHQKGDFPDRATFEAYVKQHLEPLVKAESGGKQFSTDAEKQKKAGDLLAGTNFWQLAENYKGEIARMTEEYADKCRAEGREVNQEQLMSHLQGLLQFDLQLGLKDRDLANNKPDAFLAEYEKYKSGAGVFKFFNQGGYKRVIFNPFTYGMVWGAGGGLVTRAIANGVSRKGLLAAGAVVGYGAMASFAAPIVVGAGMGAYWAWKRRRRQAEDDVRNAQRYEALGGQLSTVLDAKKTGLFKGKKELRYASDLQIQAGDAIAELKRILGSDSLSDDDKKKAAGICARLDIKQDKIADLFKADEQTGKKYSSSEVVDSQLKILRGQLEDKFNLSDADWQKMVGDARKLLIEQVGAAEKNITDFKNYEGRKAGVMGFVAGGAGAVFGQHIMYGGLEWMSKHLGMHGVAEYFTHHGTTFDRARAYFAGDKSKNLALFPLFESAPGARGIHGAPLTDRLTFAHHGAFETGSKVSSDLHWQEISSHGGIRRFGILDGTGRSLGQFELNEATGKMVEVPGTVNHAEIDFLKHETTAPTHGPGGGGRKFSLDELRKMGFDRHPRIDWHDEKEISGFEGKQQFLHKKVLPDGKVQLNIHKILQTLEVNAKNAEELTRMGAFGINPDHPKFPKGTIDMKLGPLKEQLVNWYNKGIQDAVDAARVAGRTITPDGPEALEGGRAGIAKHLSIRIIPTEEANKAGLSMYSSSANTRGVINIEAQYGKAAYFEVDVIDDNGTGHALATDKTGLEMQTEGGSDDMGGHFDKNLYEIVHKAAEAGKGYDMPLTPAYWRRKNFNKRRKVGEQSGQTSEHSGEPEGVSVRQGGTEERPGGNTEATPKPKMTKEQAKAMTDELIAVAADPGKTDEQVLASARAFEEAGKRNEISAEIIEQVHQDLETAPEPARTRLHKALEIVASERTTTTATETDWDILDDDDLGVTLAEPRKERIRGDIKEIEDLDAELRSNPSKARAKELANLFEGETGNKWKESFDIKAYRKEWVPRYAYKEAMDQYAGEKLYSKWGDKVSLNTQEVFSNQILTRYKKDIFAQIDNMADILGKADKAKVEAAGKLNIKFVATGDTARLDKNNIITLPVKLERGKLESFLKTKFGIEAASQPSPDDFGQISQELIETSGHRVHFNMDYKHGEMPEKQRAGLLRNLNQALTALSEIDRQKVLDRKNRTHAGGQMARGLIVAFDVGHGRPSFDKQDNLILSPSSTVDQIKALLLREVQSPGKR